MKVKSNTKYFWKFVRSNTKAMLFLNSMENSDGRISTDNQTIAEVLNNHFNKVFTRKHINQVPDIDDANTEAIHDVFINDQIVTKINFQINCSKSKDPEEFHPRIIKECSNEIQM